MAMRICNFLCWQVDGQECMELWKRLLDTVFYKNTVVVLSAERQTVSWSDVCTQPTPHATSALTIKSTHINCSVNMHIDENKLQHRWFNTGTKMKCSLFYQT